MTELQKLLDEIKGRYKQGCHVGEGYDDIPRLVAACEKLAKALDKVSNHSVGQCGHLRRHSDNTLTAAIRALRGENE